MKNIIDSFIEIYFTLSFILITFFSVVAAYVLVVLCFMGIVSYFTSNESIKIKISSTLGMLFGLFPAIYIATKFWASALNL